MGPGMPHYVFSGWGRNVTSASGLEPQDLWYKKLKSTEQTKFLVPVSAVNIGG